MIILIYILTFNIALAQENGKTDIYLKGGEGERLISTEDLQCANISEQGPSSVASFRLKTEAAARVKNFTEDNRGIKANLIVCGTPLAFHLGSRIGEKDALISVTVPKKFHKCALEAVKGRSACK